MFSESSKSALRDCKPSAVCFGARFAYYFNTIQLRMFFVANMGDKVCRWEKILNINPASWTKQTTCVALAQHWSSPPASE